MWTKRDGTKISVSVMSRSHLKNALAMCERNSLCHISEALLALSYANTAPDGAAYAAEQTANESFDLADVSDHWIRTFQAELNKRA